MKTNLSKLFAASMILVVAVAIALSGCKQKENEPEPQPQPQPQPQPTQSLNGNVERPVWEVPSSYDFTSSMTVTLKVDLLAQYPESAKDFELKNGDLVAAFIGQTCLGVDTLKEESDGLFFLYISGPDSAEEPENVTIRYYSSHYKNLFVAEGEFPFVNDVILGSISEPYVPKLLVADK